MLVQRRLFSTSFARDSLLTVPCSPSMACLPVPALSSFRPSSENIGASKGDSKWIVSDCDAVHNIFDPHRFATDDVHAAADALNAGVDIDCGTTYPDNLGAALNASLITEEKLRLALRRQYASLIGLGHILLVLLLF